MDLRVETEGKGFSRRDFRSSRSRNCRSLKSNLLEKTFGHVNSGMSMVSQGSEDGAVRIKLVVRKQDLKQMMEMVEERLSLLRRKHLSRVTKESKQRSWIPVLECIPEEL